MVAMCTHCSSSPLNIGMTLAISILSGTIPERLSNLSKVSMALGMNLNIVLELMLVAHHSQIVSFDPHHSPKSVF